ncbi:MAG: MFS transporter [Thermoplasmata archaeon]|nr:MAG: MFS transporter [Thermoplasmata archaeon]
MEKLTRDIFLLGIISFFADASSETIMPVLPFFIAALGGGGLALGAIAGIGDGIASLSKIFSGTFSDKIGKRKIFIASGYSLSAVAKISFPFSSQWWHLVFLRGIERIGKGVRGAPRDALIGDLYKERRGEAYGIHRALDTAGAVVGSFLAFFLFWLLKIEIKTILMIAAIIAFFAIPPIFFVREIKFVRKKEKGEVSSGLKKFTAIASIFSLGNFSYMFLLWRIGGSHLSYEKISYAILAYALFNIVYASLAPYFGKLSDKIGRKIVIVFGYIAFTFLCFGFIFLPNFTGFLFYLLTILLFIAYGIFFALVEGNQKAFVSDLSKYKGTGQGIFQASVGMATIPANLIAGFLWDIMPELTFLYGALLSLIAAILLSSLDIEKS